jgi:hypothetical protein
MKCPYCLEAFFENWNFLGLGEDAQGTWTVLRTECPSCKKIIVQLSFEGNGKHASFFVYPKVPARAPLSSHVPEKLAQDYSEACLVLSDSPKASAALSRRCLQNLLREKGGVKHSDLSKEIQEVLGSGRLPSHLAEAIDAVRNIGNFAAHPIKSQHTGDIVEVEPGEAEWLLDVLEGLFDFYFVQPALLQAKRAALDQKLKQAGKPPMK